MEKQAEGDAKLHDASSLESTVTGTPVEFTPEEEKTLLRRIDWHILPGLSVLYLLCFLDRTNIGNARLQGLEADLGMEGNDYNLALCLFFVTYILFEVPANLALRKFRPSLFFSAIMLGWGIIMTLMGIVTNLTGLVICRVFLGMMEAGYFPGVSFYLTLWYRRSEHAFRIAIFFSMATFAGAFGGLLAYGIGFMKNIGGFKNGWHWIFILEGILTCIVSVLAPLFIRDYPDKSKFLRPREREIAIARLARDSANEERGFEKRYIIEALKDPKLYVMVLVYLGANCSLYAISFFLPSIIAGLGYTNAQAQLLTVPPYVCACINVLLSAYISDKFQRRGYVNAFNFFLAIIGFIILETTQTPGARYVGTFFAAVGAFPGIAITIAWNANNIQDSPTKRAVGIALQSSAGSCGGIIGSYIYVAADKPEYRKGHAVMIGLNGLSFILTWVMIFWLKNENKKLDARAADQAARLGESGSRTAAKDAAEIAATGHAPARFRYMI